MDELDNILKSVIKKHAEAMPSAGENCISEEQFAEYLDNSLDPLEKENVEKHFLQCETCFQKSIIFSKTMEELEHAKQLEVPQDLKERTKRLVRQTPAKDMTEVVIEFGKNIVNIIKDTAGICTIPEPVMLDARVSGKEKEVNPVAQISTTFHGIKSDFSVEKTHDGELEIEARMTDTASGKPLNDIRVNLLSAQKELASFLTEKGSVLFQKLPFDEYVLEIYKGKDHIGSLKLPLTSAL
jgi:hypothetical protein